MADLVASVSDDAEAIAAAWLHDVVEDTPATFDELRDHFGPAVARLVGEVTDVKIVSSELADEEFQRKLMARVRMFRFEDKDVATVTTTKPIDFFPA